MVLSKISTKYSHKFVKIFVGRIEMNVRNSISSTSCTSGGEIEMVMLVTVVVLIAVVEMQIESMLIHNYWYSSCKKW